jgi:hypothetical protein
MSDATKLCNDKFAQNDELEEVCPVRGRAWTPQEVEFIYEYYPLPKNKPVEYIAKILNRSIVSVRRKIAHEKVRRTGFKNRFTVEGK